jgi:hypothetical protein
VVTCSAWRLAADRNDCSYSFASSIEGVDLQVTAGVLVTQPIPQPNDCERQLKRLGVQLAQLLDALRAGEEARRLTTANDPRNAAGTVDYFRRIRALRERKIAEDGWARLDLNMLPLVVNPARTVAIGVLLGDYRTGWPGPYHPHSRRPVGDGKIRLIARNQQQMTLFPEIHNPQEVDLDSEDLSRLQTWFLISYRHLFGGHVTISSELSLPSETGETRYITRYKHRIPLPELRFDGVIPYMDEDDDGGEGEYDVTVDEK